MLEAIIKPHIESLDEGGAWGWVRWRYYDPDAGKTNFYVEEFKRPY